MSNSLSGNGNALARVRNWWTALAIRERRLAAAAGCLAAAALLWGLALAPALGTLKAADKQHRALDSQLQHMLALKAQAASLQTQARAGGEDSRRVIETSLKQSFGSAGTFQLAGERASVTLKGVSGQALANWLLDVRANALALPAEARLTRPAAPGAADAWDASLVLYLPAR